MSESFNIFDSHDQESEINPNAWQGMNLCRISEPHLEHNWRINFLGYGEVEYYCPGVGEGIGAGGSQS